MAQVQLFGNWRCGFGNSNVGCFLFLIGPAGGSDVFSSSVIVEKVKNSAAQSREKIPKQPGKVVLFDDDDDDFFVGVTKKPPDSGTSIHVKWKIKH